MSDKKNRLFHEHPVFLSQKKNLGCETVVFFLIPQQRLTQFLFTIVNFPYFDLGCFPVGLLPIPDRRLPQCLFTIDHQLEGRNTPEKRKRKIFLFCLRPLPSQSQTKWKARGTRLQKKLRKLGSVIHPHFRKKHTRTHTHSENGFL